MSVPCILVSRRCLISVCMFYCVGSFAHIECYSDWSRMGSHLVETPLLRYCLLRVVPSL